MEETQIKKNELNNKAGITLIALVVTIVVLLILAGVSIVTLSGDNGLLNRTTSAKEKTEQAGIMENIKLAYQNALIGQYTNDGISIANQIKEDLEKIYVGSTIEVNKEDDTYTVTTPDGTYTIDANGNVSKKDGITVVQNNIVLQIIDGTPQDAVTITPKIEGLEGQEITWKISEGVAADKEKVVLTVEEDKQSATIGIKEGVTEGTTGEIKIEIAASGGEKATVTVRVVKIVNVSSISINPTTDVTLKTAGTTDRTVELTATILPNDATNKEINWTITTEPESGVASLSSTTGNTVTVTAGSKGGTVTVTATAVADDTKTASKTITVERVLGYFKQEGTVAYYYPSPDATNAERIQITNNPEDEGYIGKYLGTKVSYTPGNAGSATYGTSKTYRLFYIDLSSGTNGSGKYGEGQGTIYLKADCSGTTVTLDKHSSHISSDNRTIMLKLNPGISDTLTNDGNDGFVTWITDPNEWSAWKDETIKLDNDSMENGVKYVVGGPSLEMYVDSYNAYLDAHIENNVVQIFKNGSTTDRAEKLDCEYVTSGYNAKGYRIGFKNTEKANWENTGYAQNRNSLFAYDTSNGQQMYNAGRNGYYWLASPTAACKGYLVLVDSDGGYIGYNGIGLKFCPLVCIKSGASISEAR